MLMYCLFLLGVAPGRLLHLAATVCALMEFGAIPSLRDPSPHLRRSMLSTRTRSSNATSTVGLYWGEAVWPTMWRTQPCFWPLTNRRGLQASTLPSTAACRARLGSQSA